jgi:hypothetical protein
MANQLDKDIRTLVDSFADELTARLRQAIDRAVDDAVAGVGRGRARVGRPAGTSRKAAGKKKSSRTAKRTARRGVGYRRSPEELEKLTRDLLREIKKKPDRRIEEIGASMGVDTKILNLPAKKLIADKLVKTKGQKRATRYAPS